MVDEADGAVCHVSHAPDLGHDGIDGHIVILIDRVRADEWVDEQAADFLFGDLAAEIVNQLDIGQHALACLDAKLETKVSARVDE